MLYNTLYMHSFDFFKNNYTPSLQGRRQKIFRREEGAMKK